MWTNNGSNAILGSKMLYVLLHSDRPTLEFMIYWDSLIDWGLLAPSVGSHMVIHHIML
jgi:hypothetical protein